jgi:pyruvate dehydrogenase E2 component (dihydrolipoamide acetyltransferase)
MSKEIEKNDQIVSVPDIGGSQDVEVIDILVQVDMEILPEQSLVTLEGDKATMDIPSPYAGVVTSIEVKLGDKVSEGSPLLRVKLTTSEAVASEENDLPKKEAQAKVEAVTEEQFSKSLIEVCIPDIGGSQNVDVIDVLVKEGMLVEKEQALVTLEGDKATMDIPSPYKGLVKQIQIRLGDKVSQGSPILTLEAEISSAPTVTTESPVTQPAPVPEVSRPVIPNEPMPTESFAMILAGPSVRRMARELGVRLQLVKGSARKGRIIKEDVQAYVKARLSEQSSGGISIPQSPAIDFTRFGEIESKPLNKIKKLTAQNLHRAWLTIPHVTQFDEADISDLEAYRRVQIEKRKDLPYKLTLLAFVCEIVCRALKDFPQFNTSLDPSGEALIYKHYYNIGIAVETPNGLVVPVLKGVDKLNVDEIAAEMAKLSSKAREKGLTPLEMSGGCFTISSLGGLGGTAFTPIVNSPEVAILGLSRSQIKPVYIDGQFQPKLMLPLSLSYDHRVIDGAEAARFLRFIAEQLGQCNRAATVKERNFLKPSRP